MNSLGYSRNLEQSIDTAVINNQQDLSYNNEQISRSNPFQSSQTNSYKINLDQNLWILISSIHLFARLKLTIPKFLLLQALHFLFNILYDAHHPILRIQENFINFNIFLIKI